MLTLCVGRSLGSLSTLFGQVVRGMSSGSRVFQYITIDKETHLQCGGLSLGDVEGTVHFTDVQFSYIPLQTKSGGERSKALIWTVATALHITSKVHWHGWIFLHLAPNLTLSCLALQCVSLQ